MRAVRDSQLPEPYRTWIGQQQPLPDDVQLLPRSIQVWFDLWTVMAATLPFGARGNAPAA